MELRKYRIGVGAVGLIALGLTLFNMAVGDPLLGFIHAAISGWMLSRFRWATRMINYEEKSQQTSGVQYAPRKSAGTNSRKSGGA